MNFLFPNSSFNVAVYHPALKGVCLEIFDLVYFHALHPALTRDEQVVIFGLDFNESCRTPLDVQDTAESTFYGF